MPARDTRRIKPKSINVIAACIALALCMTTGCDWIKARFYIFHMESEDRVAKLNVQRIINALEIRPGIVIADIGAGSGLFTFPLADRSGPGGTVYASDINPKLLEHISGVKRPGKSGAVIPVLAAENDPKLPVTVDLVFFCDTLHYIADQPGYLARLAAYVKPGGRIAIIDFTQNWPPSSNRFTTRDLSSWMEKAGFKVSTSHEFIQDEFFIVFSRVQ
jgi:arsenite methyltransferase